jgi:phospholipid/cholesterol/gamma-HCH transport system substrate-binding protein
MMKKSKTNRVKLGIFVTITIALFISGIYFIGQRQQLFGSTFHVSGVFKDISGLQVGNNVRFSGINVGIIQDIEQTTDSTVRVDMIIDEHTRKFIKKNAKAIIGSDGLMGNKIIIITPGTTGKQELSDNDTIATTQPINMNDILEKIKITSDNAANITGNLSAIVDNMRNGKGTIGKLFMDSLFAENLNQTITKIKQGAGGFNQNMNAASHNFLLKGFFKKKKKKDTNEKNGK